MQNKNSTSGGKNTKKTSQIACVSRGLQCWGARDTVGGNIGDMSQRRSGVSACGILWRFDSILFWTSSAQVLKVSQVLLWQHGMHFGIRFNFKSDRNQGGFYNKKQMTEVVKTISTSIHPPFAEGTLTRSLNYLAYHSPEVNYSYRPT